jgi:effector-binding domain-containing protein
MRIASALAIALALAVPAIAEDAAPQTGTPLALQEGTMQLTAVELTPQPMIYVSTRSSMEPQAIQQVVGGAFEALGKFLGEAQVIPLGPPLAIYSNWSEGQITTHVGFPVSAADAAKATGSILAGSTPGGHALKAVHKGSYEGMAATYAAIEAQMASTGIAQGTVSWEVYVGDPETTAAAELITEIYMQISAEDAAKLPAN